METIRAMSKAKSTAMMCVVVSGMALVACSGESTRRDHQAERADGGAASNVDFQPGHEEEPGEGPPADSGRGTRVLQIAELPCSFGNGSCGVFDDGSLRCWGAFGSSPHPDNCFPGCPTGPLPCAMVPTPWPEFSNVKSFFGASCDEGSTGPICVTTMDGTVECSGVGTVAGLHDVVQVGGGLSHACALLEDGHVACWGENGNGQLGVPSIPVATLTPTLVPGLTGVAQIEVGGSTTCARLTDGTVKCWGFIGSGTGGCATGPATGCVGSPTTVPGITGTVEIAGGCARRLDGSVTCWSFGAGATEPFGPGSHVIALVGGHCARRDDGSVWCWKGSSTPLEIPALHGAVQVSFSGTTVCFVRADGTFSCYGTDDCFGELGNGTIGSPAVCGACYGGGA
jgi:hypothetical protein